MTDEQPFDWSVLDQFPGSEEAKRRAKVIFPFLGGVGTVEEGCKQLGIDEEEFCRLCEDAAAAMMEAAERSIEEERRGAAGLT